MEEVNQTLPLTDSIISPYKKSLDKEMKEVICFSEQAMEKGQPESLLGNWVADLSFNYAKKSININPHFCILNYGGLRTSIPKGEITKERIYSLMPFENELVVVVITKEKFNQLIKYLINVGGQPVSNITIKKISEDVEKVKIEGVDFNTQKEFRVLTTDYLAKGGDKMDFFLNPIEVIYTNMKLRDVIINHCIDTNSKGKKISSQLDNRISINE
jgi:2',3'-cyclic-nucleotide 2'-phosphodiesterase (5'-nucleotidase family)